MPGSTTNYSFSYPLQTDPVDVAADIQTLATNVDTTLNTQLGLKANLSSPSFTGTPTAPTAAVDTNTLQLATTQYVINQGYAKLNSPSFTGQVTLPVGNATNAPIIFQTGSLLSTPAAGRMEYDGKLHYITPASTSGRALSAASHYYVLGADRSLSNVNTVQSIFGVSFRPESTTAYEFEMLVSVASTGTTSNSLGLSFGGTATISSIAYQVEAAQNATSYATLASSSQAFFSSAANQTITAAVATATYRTALVKGIVRINASGTFTPQLTYSAAPGQVPVVAANSYIKMFPIGANTSAVSIGAWA